MCFAYLLQFRVLRRGGVATHLTASDLPQFAHAMAVTRGVVLVAV